MNMKSWLKIGNRNLWIRCAVDPEFDEGSFHFCETWDELIDKFEHGNWCIGQAFVVGSLCFINQVNGGDEWLTIRDDIAFESVSCGLIIEKHGREYFKRLLSTYLTATDEQLRTLTFGDPKIKTYEGWEGDLSEYLQPGDIVDEEMSDYFITVLPPACMSGGCIQIGEPHDHIDGRATYATLKYTDAGWMYAGHCFRGQVTEPEKATHR